MARSRESSKRAVGLVPGLTPTGALLRAAYGGGILVPYYGLTSQALHYLADLCHANNPLFWMDVAPGVLGSIGAYELTKRALARGRIVGQQPRRLPRGKRQIVLNGMPYDEVALVCNILILGGIRSGKTSATLDWATDQLLKVFNEPGDELGGFFLDVKGSRTTRVLKFAHDAGRDVIKSCKIIRPNCSLPYGKFQDPNTKHNFFVPAVEFSTGSEASRLIAGAVDPATGEPIPVNILSWEFWQLEPHEEKLRSVEFDLRGKDVRFVGWRREGNELVRVNRTTGPWKETEYKEVHGQRLRISYPKRLRYLGVGYIDNGLHYNIVNNNIEPAEAARRLRVVGQLLNSGKAGGDNKFWDDGAESHVTQCIEMLRIVNEPGIQVDGPDIARLTSQKTFWSQKNELLKKKIEELKKRITENPSPEITSELEERLKKYNDIRAYFEEEWVVMESKTKTIMVQVIKQLFNAFLLDPKLQKSFGTKATYSFMSAITKGDLFVFGGCEYEMLAKMIGTALKTDFQSAVLTRTKNRHINQTRFLEFENDEAHEFATAGVGSGAGDDRTMSLAGESLLINILATQTMANLEAVLGKDRTRVYVGACGGIISYQITDFATAKEISEKIPEVTREHRELESDELRLSNLMAKDGKTRHRTTFKREPRYTPNDFMTLNIREWESIAYNKTMLGNDPKAHRQTNLPHPIGSPEGKAELEEFMRWYECASIEQLAWDQNKPELFSHIGPDSKTNSGSSPGTRDPSTPPAEPEFIPEAMRGKTVNANFSPKAASDLKKSLPIPPPEGPPAPEPESVDQPPTDEGADDAESSPEAETRPIPPPPDAPLDKPLAPSPPGKTPPSHKPAGVTMADLDRMRELYSSPPVIAHLANELTSILGLSEKTQYYEFLDGKMAGSTPNEQTALAGPGGVVTGNPDARSGDPLPIVTSVADEQKRLAALNARMAELETTTKAMRAEQVAPLPDAVADALASDASTEEIARRLTEEDV